MRTRSPVAQDGRPRRPRRPGAPARSRAGTSSTPCSASPTCARSRAAPRSSRAGRSARPSSRRRSSRAPGPARGSRAAGRRATGSRDGSAGAAGLRLALHRTSRARDAASTATEARRRRSSTTGCRAVTGSDGRRRRRRSRRHRVTESRHGPAVDLAQQPPQVDRHVARRLVPLLAVLLERLQDEVLELRRQSRIDAPAAAPDCARGSRRSLTAGVGPGRAARRPPCRRAARRTRRGPSARPPLPRATCSGDMNDTVPIARPGVVRSDVCVSSVPTRSATRPPATGGSSRDRSP